MSDFLESFFCWPGPSVSDIVGALAHASFFVSQRCDIEPALILFVLSLGPRLGGWFLM
jgi:hypothetical protein